MDPHQRSATTEVMAGGERILGGGRFAADAAGPARVTDINLEPTLPPDVLCRTAWRVARRRSRCTVHNTLMASTEDDIVGANG